MLRQQKAMPPSLPLQLLVQPQTPPCLQSEASDSAAEAAQSAEEAAAAAGMSVYGASLVDDEDAAEARSTLGLGNSATKDTGTGSDDVATGNHTHAVGTIVGIGDSASKDVGTGSDEVAAGNHAHDDTYYTETEVDGFLAGKSDTSHTHDSRYYTETETDSLLSGKSDTSHDHDSDYIATTAKGAASGVAELDAGGKIPTAQIPDSVLHSMEYKGSFDASGGAYPSPAELEAGWYYVCNVAGTISGTPYANGDWAVYNGTSWDKINNNAVVSSGCRPDRCRSPDHFGCRRFGQFRHQGCRNRIGQCCPR